MGLWIVAILRSTGFVKGPRPKLSAWDHHDRKSIPYGGWWTLDIERPSQIAYDSNHTNNHNYLQGRASER